MRQVESLPFFRKKKKNYRNPTIFRRRECYGYKYYSNYVYKFRKCFTPV